MTTTEKPIGIPCPPKGFYWVLVYDRVGESWKPGDWELAQVFKGAIQFIGDNESYRWDNKVLVVTDAREIKPPTEETV